MAIKKKSTKKKPTRKKTTGGIAAFNRKVQKHPAVSGKTRRIKALESALKKLKKEKAIAVKGVRKKLSK